ncbi:hypothetical protein [Aliivibrio salmonicida]|uniref:hypothetical protein n=1 Tax=Aliivibrio salmonicida TaxID=40269 RepID=UPI003D0A9B3D
MAKCKNCRAILPLLPSRRSFVEKHITQRNTKKYKCKECDELQFRSPFSSKADAQK